MKKKFLSIIFAAVMATCGVFAAGCGKENKTTNKTPTSEEIIISGKEEEAIPMPKAMSFSAPTLLSDSGEPVAQTSSVTLTAAVEPSNATYQAVDWSVSFDNPSSTWASGKTASNYVTVTPTSDGALTAKVECLSAFGEPIKVTVRSRDNADASATCVCDYLKPVEDFELRLSQNDHNVDKITVYKTTTATGNVSILVNPVYGLGTKEGNISAEVSLSFANSKYFSTTPSGAKFFADWFRQSWSWTEGVPAKFISIHTLMSNNYWTLKWTPNIYNFVAGFIESKYRSEYFTTNSNGYEIADVNGVGEFIRCYRSFISLGGEFDYAFLIEASCSRNGVKLHEDHWYVRGLAAEDLYLSVTGLSLNNTTLEF